MRRHPLYLALLVATSMSAQQFVGVPVDSKSIAITKDIVYRTVAGQTLKFDLYRPAGDAIVPVAITCNVGNPGMKDWDGYVGWGKATAAAGIAAVHYEAIGQDPTANFDVLMETLRAKSAALHIDPTRVVLWAGSSNVQLGLPLAMDAQRDYIRGAVIYYGSANVTAIRTDLPLYFVRAGLDQQAQNAAIDGLISRALAANASWTIENYGGGLHGFDIFNDNDVSREIIARTLKFMTRVVTPELTDAYAATSRDAALVGAFNRGEWTTAIEGYTKRVAARPDDADAHLRLGLSLNGGGRHAEALTQLEEAWRLGRRGPRDTGLPAARAAAGSGNIARTVYWLDIVLSTPFVTLDAVRGDAIFASVLENPSVVGLLGEIEEQNAILALLESDRTADGMKALTASKSARLGREGTLNSMGYRLLNRGHTESALGVFQLVTARHPKSANAWESYSEALERAGRSADAVKQARRALELEPGDQVRQAAQQRIARLSGS